MKIKFGMMVTDGRGKLGGQVASKNRSGSYIRTKVTPVNPNTSFQSAVRQRLGSLSAEWGNLTESQRLAWNESANSGEWNKTDIFGDARRPTGKNLFTGINVISLETSETLLVDVPKKANFAQFALVQASAVVGGTMQVTVRFDELPDEDSYLQVEATTAVSPGRYYLKNLYRSLLSGVDNLTAGSNVIGFEDDYAERFGELQATNAGQRIGFRVRQVLNGQATPWVATSIIVASAP